MTTPDTARTNNAFGLSRENSLYDGHRTWPKRSTDKDFDWENAWIDQGPSPAGNKGPYVKLCHIPDGTVHRIYPKHYAWQTFAERLAAAMRPQPVTEGLREAALSAVEALKDASFKLTGGACPMFDEPRKALEAALSTVSPSPQPGGLREALAEAIDFIGTALDGEWDLESNGEDYPQRVVGNLQQALRSLAATPTTPPAPSIDGEILADAKHVVRAADNREAFKKAKNQAEVDGINTYLRTTGMHQGVDIARELVRLATLAANPQGVG